VNRLLLCFAGDDLFADDDQTRGDPDACAQRSAVEIQRADRIDCAEPGVHGALGIVLVCLRIAEIDQNAVAHVFGNGAAMLCNHTGAGFLILADQIGEILRVQPGRKLGGTDQVAEHDRQMPAFGALQVIQGGGRSKGFVGQRRQVRNGLQQSFPFRQTRDAKVLEVFVGQFAKQGGIDAVFLKCHRVLIEPKASQPRTNVHSRLLLGMAKHNTNTNGPKRSKQKVWIGLILLLVEYYSAGASTSVVADSATRRQTIAFAMPSCARSRAGR